MKKFLIVLLVLVLAIFAIWKFVFNKEKKPSGPKQQPIAQSKYSESFNESIHRVMNAYYGMTEGFVNWDTTVINKYSAELKVALDSLSLEEVKKDTLIYQTAISSVDNSKTELTGLIQDATLDEKRGSLNIFSNYLYDLLRTVKYDAAKVYLQECPMAFNDENPGNWLSETNAVRNPYLGMHHPKYGKGMLTCGGPKDTLNFMSAESTKK